jgi:hypothetical protein
MDRSSRPGGAASPAPRYSSDSSPLPPLARRWCRKPSTTPSASPLLDAWYDWLEDPATLSPKTRCPFSPKTIQAYRWCGDQLLALLPSGREAQLTDLTPGFVADFRALRAPEEPAGLPSTGI